MAAHLRSLRGKPGALEQMNSELETLKAAAQVQKARIREEEEGISEAARLTDPIDTGLATQRGVMEAKLQVGIHLRSKIAQNTYLCQERSNSAPYLPS